MRGRLALLALLVVPGLLGLAVGTTATRPVKRPHVIVVCVDGCRADRLGCYGYGRNTSPNLDRLAAEGVRFTLNQAQSNESLFSHASLFTSRYPSEVGPLAYEKFIVREDLPYLPRILKAQGYATGGFTGGGHINGDYGFNRGFDVYYDEIDFSDFRHSVPRALAWAAQPSDQPRFLFLHGYDCHRPYYKEGVFRHLFTPDYAGHADRFLRSNGILDRVFAGAFYPDFAPTNLLTTQGHHPNDPRDYLRLGEAARKGTLIGTPLQDGEVEHLRSHYDNCVAFADLWVGFALARLRELGYTERNTLLLVTSDHGEDLMEHGVFNHRIGLQQANTHTPLIVWGWGVDRSRRGTRVDALTQNLDLAPTLLSMLGLAEIPSARGRDLSGWLKADPVAPPPAPGFAEGILGMSAIFDERYSLIGLGAMPGSAEMVERLRQGSYEFFDRQKDPGELSDQARAAEYQAVRDALRDRLVQKEGVVLKVTVPARQKPVDPKLLRELQDHGYW